MKVLRHRGGACGNATIAAMIFLMVCFAIVAGYLALSSNDARLTRMTVDQEETFIVAEAGLEYGILKLKDILLEYQFNPAMDEAALQALLDAIPAPTCGPPYAHRTPGGQSAFRIRVESPVAHGLITNGISCRGATGGYQYFTVVCGAINTNTGAGSVVRQTVQAVGLPVIQFGVFYEEDLEIFPDIRMDFRGPVHANGRMYLGGPLVFHDRVTAHGEVFARRKDTGERAEAAQIRNAAGALVSMNDGEYLDSDHPAWMVESLRRWDGYLLSVEHGVSWLRAPIAPGGENHEIIERPLATNDVRYRAATEAEKFSGKAGLTLHVASDGAVRVTDAATNVLSASFGNVILREGGSAYGMPVYEKDPASGAYRFASNSPPHGVYDVTQTAFYDRRENLAMSPMDLYLDRLQGLLTNASMGLGEGIVYVTRDDPDGVSNGVLPCVRLRNGSAIMPPNGLTIASDLPVYIEGDFNTEGVVKPCLVAGDAVTLLSKDWQDAASAQEQKDRRVPTNTAYRTVVMTGNSETVPGGYNGGLENVLRFLEDWGEDREVVFRGSIVNLWQTQTVSGPWDSSYYTPPRRDWGYDDLYRTQTPPGMTHVFGMEELFWTRTTWAAEGWSSP